MDNYVKATLLYRLQLVEEEINHMAEDIVAAREQLEKAEKQLLRMNEERIALTKHIRDGS